MSEFFDSSPSDDLTWLLDPNFYENRIYLFLNTNIFRKNYSIFNFAKFAGFKPYSQN